MNAFIYYLLTVNAVGLLLMLIDKKKAQNHRWRIPEADLLGIAILGGSFGSFLGMKLFRHKTRHPKFSIGLPIIMGIQAVLIFIFYKSVI